MNIDIYNVKYLKPKPHNFLSVINTCDCFLTLTMFFLFLNSTKIKSLVSRNVHHNHWMKTSYY